MIWGLQIHKALQKWTWGPAAFTSQIQANSRRPSLKLAGEGERYCLPSDLKVALRTCLLECHHVFLKRKTQDALPLSTRADNSACQFLQIWGIFYCRWWEQGLPSALRCFVTRMNSTMTLPCGMYYINSLILLSFIPITCFTLDAATDGGYAQLTSVQNSCWALSKIWADSVTEQQYKVLWSVDIVNMFFLPSFSIKVKIIRHCVRL